MPDVLIYAPIIGRGGVHRMVTRLAEAWVNIHGWSFTVLSQTVDEAGAPIHWPAGLTVVPIDGGAPPRHPNLFPWLYQQQQTFYDHWRRMQADIAYLPMPWWTTRLPAFKPPMPTVLTLHDFAWDQLGQRNHEFRAEARTFAQHDLFTCFPSSYQRMWGEQHYGFKRTRTVYHGHFIPATFLATPHEAARVQAHYGLPERYVLAFHVGNSKKDPLTAQAVNTGGTETLDIVRNGHPVIFASTGSVYGKLETMCDESVTPRPLTVYGHSKLLAERLLLDSGNAMVYRFATAFGLSPRMRLDLLPNDFTYQAVSNRYLLVYERHYRRTFIHVYDIARALAHALDHFDRMTGQVYNCGSNDLNATKEAVVSLIATQTDFKVHYVDIGSDADQRDYEVDYKRLAETGFQTTVGLPDGIAEMVRAFRHLNIHNPYSNVG